MSTLTPKIAAIKNVLGKPTKLTHNAQSIRFAKDEVKIVSQEAAAHAVTRQVGVEISVPSDEDPTKKIKRLFIRTAFKQVPVSEAVAAGAKFDENPHVAEEARRLASEKAQRDAERAEWEKGFEEKFLATLKDKGLAIVPAPKPQQPK